MMRDQVDKALLDEAVRLGAIYSDRLIEYAIETQHLHQMMWQVVSQLRRGNADAARRQLEAEIAASVTRCAGITDRLRSAR